MDNPTATPAPAATPPVEIPAPAATPETPESYINPDGTFKEGWQKQYVPAEYQHLEQVFSGVKSAADMAKMIGNQNTTISRQGKGLFPPTKDSSPAEIEMWRKGIGVPETPAGYTFTIPTELEKYYMDKEFIAEAQAELHRLNLTPEQFTGVMALDAKRMLKSEEAALEDPVALFDFALEKAGPLLAERAKEELSRKWGDAYAARLDLANQAIADHVPDGPERIELLKRIGNDPIVADFIATMQQKHYTESHGVDTSLGTGSASMNIDQRIQAIMSNPDYISGQRNPTLHQKLVEECFRLQQQKNPGNV